MGDMNTHKGSSGDMSANREARAAVFLASDLPCLGA